MLFTELGKSVLSEAFGSRVSQIDGLEVSF